MKIATALVFLVGCGGALSTPDVLLSDGGTGGDGLARALGSVPAMASVDSGADVFVSRDVATVSDLRSDVSSDTKPDTLPTGPRCRGGGVVVHRAVYWCKTELDKDPCPDMPGRPCSICTNGHYDGYYKGLPCPFDVVVASEFPTKDCAGCAEGAIITNRGMSQSAVWRNTAQLEYYCEGNNVCVDEVR